MVLVGSVAARIWLGGDEPPTPPTDAAAQETPSGLQPQGFVPTEPGDSQEPPAASTREVSEETAEALPVVSEASFFGLIGFALGYASRKVVKIGLVLLAVAFAGLQGLVYLGVVQIDWGRALEVVNNFVLNIHEGQSTMEILQARIPSAGALALGYVLGFRKG